VARDRRATKGGVIQNMPDSNSFGRPLHAQSTRSLVVHKSFGAMLVVVSAAILIAYRGFLLRSLRDDISSVAIFSLLILLTIAGFLLVLSRRRAILFENGIAIPELRLIESFGPTQILPYNLIARASLVTEPGGDRGWILVTGDGRRLTIWEGDFSDPNAVHQLLTTVLRGKAVAND